MLRVCERCPPSPARFRHLEWFGASLAFARCAKKLIDMDTEAKCTPAYVSEPVLILKATRCQSQANHQ
ncbi:hypothetical protein NDU88_004730 [Pleurodeles waltl]|uniref:Uncharacterized protein n=1 Tax=Pleurodeles waltl TaxID=8319 RepID=A0AAV7UHW3_PLEWA|nr:hypothetical protein NDU88_004730 [Pleurodeles waltl]